MSIVLSTVNFPNSRQVGRIYIKSTNESRFFVSDSGEAFYYRGEIFDPQDGIAGIAKRIHQYGFNKIQDFDGEFAVICYDPLTDTIKIGNDYLGRETLFYYHTGGQFIISDDFWEIVNIIEPDENAIDDQGVFENIILQRPLNYRTIVKNLFYFPAATLGNYSIEAKRLSLSTYWDLRYESDAALDIKVAVEQLDAEFKKFFGKLLKMYPSNTRFLLGLSGGLDSRLAAAYGKQYGLNISYFIIGDKRPNMMFISRDHANAHALARYFGAKVLDLDYDKTPYSEKMFLEARYFPLHHARLFHTQKMDALPDYDVMLNGLMGGETMGSEVRQAHHDLNENLLAEYLYLHTDMFKGHILYKKKLNLFNRILNRLRKPDDGRYLLETYIKGRSQLENVREYFKQFIDEETRNKKTGVDIMQKILFYNISSDKYGSFSMYQGKPNHSIFHPVVKLSMTWPFEFLLNKKLQIAFFKTKFPDIAKIPAQDHLEPIYYRDHPGWRKHFYSFAYDIRGTGSLSHRTKAYRRDYLDFAHALLREGNSTVERMFDTQKFSHFQIAPHENLLKAEFLLNILQKKSYKTWMTS